MKNKIFLIFLLGCFFPLFSQMVVIDSSKVVRSIRGGCLPINETDTTFIEIKIFSSGEGYIVMGEKKGKIHKMNIELNIETDLLGGEIFYINYKTGDWIWGDYYPMELYITQPQESERDVTDEFIQIKR